MGHFGSLLQDSFVDNTKQAINPAAVVISKQSKGSLHCRKGSLQETWLRTCTQKTTSCEYMKLLPNCCYRNKGEVEASSD